MEKYRTENTASALDALKGVIEKLPSEIKEKIVLDFSVTGNANYYNGVTFNGFVSGVPTEVLKGGQYDNLMKKMKRKDKAIGFAVYLDELGKLKD